MLIHCPPYPIPTTVIFSETLCLLAILLGFMPVLQPTRALPFVESFTYPCPVFLAILALLGIVQS